MLQYEYPCNVAIILVLCNDRLITQGRRENRFKQMQRRQEGAPRWTCSIEVLVKKAQSLWMAFMTVKKISKILITSLFVIPIQ